MSSEGLIRRPSEVWLDGEARAGTLRVASLARRVAAALAVLVPLLVFTAHASLFADWLIDDAGISFAYARNLALGHGLVSQPGLAPVEGFSNPLWTLLLAASYALGLFDPGWTPKAISLALVAASFALIVTDLRRGAAPAWLAGAAPLLLALSTPFALWTTSGLENPLLALLLALLVALARVAVDETADAARLDLGIGVVASLLALVRPDAVVIAAGFPLSVALTSGDALRRRAWGKLALRVARFAAGFLPAYLGYLVFRRLYFGDWVPNTYHAKEKPALASLLDVAKLDDLLRAETGLAAWALGLVLAGAVAALAAHGRLRPRHAALLVHLALALASYLLLPLDWMGEYRFATGAILLLSWTIADLAGALARMPRPRLGLALGAGLAVLVGLSLEAHADRSKAVADAPVTAFADIERFALGYNQLAATLGRPEASLLAPDLGGALWASTLRVYDLVGLCDRTTARTLTRDTPAFHRYVFEEARPTFIHVHGPWSGWAALHRSPAFERDYLPIHEAWANPRGPDAAREHEGEPWRGDYVRRDALGDVQRNLARLRRSFETAGLDRARF